MSHADRIRSAFPFAAIPHSSRVAARTRERNNGPYSVRMRLSASAACGPYAHRYSAATYQHTVRIRQSVCVPYACRMQSVCAQPATLNKGPNTVRIRPACGNPHLPQAVRMRAAIQPPLISMRSAFGNTYECRICRMRTVFRPPLIRHSKECGPLTAIHIFAACGPYSAFAFIPYLGK